MPPSQNIKTPAKNLGIIFNSDLSFQPHTWNVTKSASYHLRNTANVRPVLTQGDAEKRMYAFITSRLDYCNTLHSGLPTKALGQLQSIQNAAGVLTKTRKRTHITPVLKSVHW